MAKSQKFLGWINVLFTERYLSTERVNCFILKKCQHLSTFVKLRRLDRFSDLDLQNILRIFDLTFQMGWITQVPGFPFEMREEYNSKSSNLDWQAASMDGKLIHKGVLASDSAAYLLKAVKDGQINELAEKNMELLLRHVEVKRTQSLQKYEQEMSRVQIWKEKCNFAILFSRYAYQKKDWRYLNAALKLNEWLWKEYHRPFSNRPSLPYLTALVEQEFTLKKMEQC